MSLQVRRAGIACSKKTTGCFLAASAFNGSTKKLWDELRAKMGICLRLSAMLQACQFAIGAGVAWRTWPAVLAKEGWLDIEAPGSDLRGMRGVFVVGCVFCFMAVRNFQATVATIIDKRKYARAKARAAANQQKAK